MPGRLCPVVVSQASLSIRCFCWTSFRMAGPFGLPDKALLAVDRFDDPTISDAPMPEDLSGHEPVSGGVDVDPIIGEPVARITLSGFG